MLKTNMIYKFKTKLSVGERAVDDRRKIELDGIILESTSSKEKLYFCQGFSAKASDYLQLLEMLAEEFTVITYDHRGHAKSQGKYCPDYAVNDLHTILEQQKIRECHMLGHSMGCAIAINASEREEVKKLCLIAPYLNQVFLPFLFRNMIMAINIITYFPGLVQGIDALLDCLLPANINNKKLLQSLAALYRTQAKTCEKPVAFMLSNKDNLLRTENPKRYELLKTEILKHCRDATDLSAYVADLNHCLNLKKEDISPLLKPELGKNSQEIADAIIKFYKK